MRQEKKQACFLVPYKRFHSFFSPLYVRAHTLGSGHYAKYLQKKIWTLFSVRQRFGIRMTFCRDKENHWLPTQ